MDLTNKTIVITGATSGIGLATMEALAGQGATLIGISRNPDKCSLTEKIVRLRSGNPRIYYLPAELSLQGEIRALSLRITELLHSLDIRHLDGLVNNAGTFTWWMALTSEGVETQWAVNHLAGFLLTHQLLPLLQASPAARVVTVSSASHRQGRMDWSDPQLRRRYFGLHAYENTKLANVLFTTEFNRRYSGSHVQAFALDPGLVNTEIGLKGTPSIASRVWNLRRAFGTSAEVPAHAIVHLLTVPVVQQSSHPYWKDGKPKTSSLRSRNSLDAARLWKYSQNLCAITGEQNDIQKNNSSN